MAARKRPISLDPLTAGDGAPGRMPAFVQTGCTTLGLKRYFAILCVPGPTLDQYKLQGRSGRICAPRVHNERAKLEMAVLALIEIRTENVQPGCTNEIYLMIRRR
jgi:hypothetical protein